MREGHLSRAARTTGLPPPRLALCLAVSLLSGCLAPAIPVSRGTTGTGPGDGRFLLEPAPRPVRTAVPVPASSSQDDLPYSLGLDDPPVGKAWQLWVEPGVRNFRTRNLEGGADATAFKLTGATGPIIPTVYGQALVPTLFLSWSEIDTRRADGGWRVLSPGVGFRYLVIADRIGDLYLQADLAYTSWRYRGDDFPGSRRTPDCSIGRDWGLGVGGSLYPLPWLGLGGSVVYRDYRGSNSYRLVWVDTSVLVSLRF